MSNGQVAVEGGGRGLAARVVALVLAAGAMLLLINWASGQEVDPGPDPAPVVALSAGTIEGTVTDVDGTTPLAGLSVALVSLEDGSVAADAVTDADGAYVLAAVPEGTYRFQVGVPGLTAVVQTTEGAEAGTLEVVMPSLLLAPTPPGTPAAMQPEAAEGVVVAGEGTVTLLAAPLTYADESAAAGGVVDTTAGAGSKPPKPPKPPGNPGKPKPPAPPGRPPDKPTPPPWTSPDEP